MSSGKEDLGFRASSEGASGPNQFLLHSLRELVLREINEFTQGSREHVSTVLEIAAILKIDEIRKVNQYIGLVLNEDELALWGKCRSQSSTLKSLKNRSQTMSSLERTFIKFLSEAGLYAQLESRAQVGQLFYPGENNNRPIYHFMNGEFKLPDFQVKGFNKVVELFGLPHYQYENDPKSLEKLYREIGIDARVYWAHEIDKEWNCRMIIEHTRKWILDGISNEQTVVINSNTQEKEEERPEGLEDWKVTLLQIHPTAEQFFANYKQSLNKDPYSEEKSEVEIRHEESTRDILGAYDGVAQVAGIGDEFPPYVSWIEIVKFAAVLYGSSDPAVFPEFEKLKQEEEIGKQCGDDLDTWRSEFLKKIPTVNDWVKHIDSYQFISVGGETIRTFIARFGFDLDSFNSGAQIIFYSKRMGSDVHYRGTHVDQNLIEFGAFIYHMPIEEILRLYSHKVSQKDLEECKAESKVDPQQMKDLIIQEIKSEYTYSSWLSMSYQERASAQFRNMNLGEIASLFGITINPTISVRHHTLLAKQIWSEI